MEIFKNHNYAFVKLLAFRIQISLAYQIMAVVVGWHIYEITRDPLSLGLIGLAEVIPYFASALVAGHAVDHYYSRRLFGTLASVLLFINAFTLTALSLGWLNGEATLWIYGSIIFTGFARAFIAPSYNTLFAIIVPRKQFVKAASLGTTAFQAGLVLGPAESHKNWETIFNQSDIGIIKLSTSNKISDLNKKASQEINLDRKDALNQGIESIFDKSTLETIQNKIGYSNNDSKINAHKISGILKRRDKDISKSQKIVEFILFVDNREENNPNTMVIFTDIKT